MSNEEFMPSISTSLSASSSVSVSSNITEFSSIIKDCESSETTRRTPKLKKRDADNKGVEYDNETLKTFVKSVSTRTPLNKIQLDL